MSNKFEHANRNKELSEVLFKEGKFLDWANTTAFYSALHYVHVKLLPGKYNNVSCKNIDDVARTLRCKGKHEATCQLVRLGLPNVAEQYSYLMNCSFTARYVDYTVHPEQAKICQKFLAKIQKACIQ